MTITKLNLYYKDNFLTSIKPELTVKEIISNLNILGDDITDIKIVPESVKLEGMRLSESIVVDVPEKEYTIFSSSDFAEQGEQIPLVKIKIDDEGVPYVDATGDTEFDKESVKIAQNSLKATENRPLKDRLTRVDKTLNHNDPFLSTELSRQLIQAYKGMPKTEIDVEKIDVNDKDIEKKFSNIGLETVAKQVLLTNRDDLKALASYKSTKEEDLVDTFEDMTGVDYYTDDVIDADQYNYVLDLLGRSTDVYEESNVEPKDNAYVQSLKDLTQQLIEKVAAKNK